jgi:hypothetical protein
MEIRPTAGRAASTLPVKRYTLGESLNIKLRFIFALSSEDKNMRMNSSITENNGRFRIGLFFNHCGWIDLPAPFFKSCDDAISFIENNFKIDSIHILNECNHTVMTLVIPQIAYGQFVYCMDCDAHNEIIQKRSKCYSCEKPIHVKRLSLLDDPVAGYDCDELLTGEEEYTQDDQDAIDDYNFNNSEA